MSTRYLFPCSCGESLPIAASQAGGRLPCPACGAVVEVPRLLELRQLPTEATAPETTGRGWSFRHGLLTAGLLLAGVLGAGSAWLTATEPAKLEFDAKKFKQFNEKNIQAMTPQRLWELHNNYYLPLAKVGMQPYVTPRSVAAEEAANLSKLYQSMLRYAALGVLAITAVAFVALPK